MPARSTPTKSSGSRRKGCTARTSTKTAASCTSRARCPMTRRERPSKLQQLAGRGAQVLRALPSHEDIVLDPDAAKSRHVDARLVREDHVRLEDGLARRM